MKRPTPETPQSEETDSSSPPQKKQNTEILSSFLSTPISPAAIGDDIRKKYRTYLPPDETTPTGIPRRYFSSTIPAPDDPNASPVYDPGVKSIQGDYYPEIQYWRKVDTKDYKDLMSYMYSNYPLLYKLIQYSHFFRHGQGEEYSPRKLPYLEMIKALWEFTKDRLSKSNQYYNFAREMVMDYPGRLGVDPITLEVLPSQSAGDEKLEITRDVYIRLMKKLRKDDYVQNLLDIGSFIFPNSGQSKFYFYELLDPILTSERDTIHKQIKDETSRILEGTFQHISGDRSKRVNAPPLSNHKFFNTSGLASTYLELPKTITVRFLKDKRKHAEIDTKKFIKANFQEDFKFEDSGEKLRIISEKPLELTPQKIAEILNQKYELEIPENANEEFYPYDEASTGKLTYSPYWTGESISFNPKDLKKITHTGLSANAMVTAYCVDLFTKIAYHSNIPAYFVCYPFRAAIDKELIDDFYVNENIKRLLISIIARTADGGHHFECVVIERYGHDNQLFRGYLYDDSAADSSIGETITPKELVKDIQTGGGNRMKRIAEYVIEWLNPLSYSTTLLEKALGVGVIGEITNFYYLMTSALQVVKPPVKNVSRKLLEPEGAPDEWGNDIDLVRAAEKKTSIDFAKQPIIEPGQIYDPIEFHANDCQYFTLYNMLWYGIYGVHENKQGNLVFPALNKSAPVIPIASIKKAIREIISNGGILTSFGFGNIFSKSRKHSK